MGLRTLLLAVFFSVTALTGRAQVLLVIDDSNPSDVTITATDMAPDIQVPFGSGETVFFLDFFTSDWSGPYNIPAMATTLAATSSSFDYNSVGTGITIRIGSYNDLPLNSPSQFNGFDPGNPAFTGTASFDFSNSGFAPFLPSPGSTGVLETGGVFPEAGGITIGEWSVVATPEPSSWALFVVSIFVLAWFRHWRLN